MSKPTLIRAVRVTAPLTLEIDWSSGETLGVDVSRLVSRFKFYAPLKDSAVFATAKADERGHAVSWSGNIDMGAMRSMNWHALRPASGVPRRSTRGWSATASRSIAAADALDMTRRMIAHYRTGSRPIPRVVSLACEGWEVRRARHAA